MTNVNLPGPLGLIPFTSNFLYKKESQKMKSTQYLYIFFLVLLSACGEDNIKTSLEDFCKIKPEGWECEIIENNFNENDIPKNTKDPIAIIKYRNISREFSSFGQEVYPSLILDLYSIKDKMELIDIITSQMMFSWCIPTYYGESRDFFVITSPCFINNGTYTEEADSCIIDLHKSLENILIKKDYNFSSLEDTLYRTAEKIASRIFKLKE